MSRLTLPTFPEHRPSRRAAFRADSLARRASVFPNPSCAPPRAWPAGLIDPRPVRPARTGAVAQADRQIPLFSASKTTCRSQIADCIGRAKSPVGSSDL